MKTIYAIMFSIMSLQLAAQEITGWVFDRKDRPLPGSLVKVYKDSIFVKSYTSDMNGSFHVPLNQGIYSMQFTCMGYDSIKIVNVMAMPGHNMDLKVILFRQKHYEKSHDTICTSCPIVLKENPDSYIFSRQDILNTPR